MRDRLIELLNFVQCKAECCGALDGGRCGELDHLDRCQIETIADHFLTNGGIVPLVKIGQTVYSLEKGINSQFFSGEVYEIQIRREGVVFRATRRGYYSLAFTEENIGKTVFFTPEEAEKALAERSGE